MTTETPEPIIPMKHLDEKQLKKLLKDGLVRRNLTAQREITALNGTLSTQAALIRDKEARLENQEAEIKDMQRKLKELERDKRRVELRAKQTARTLNRTKDRAEFHMINAEEMRRHRVELKRDLARSHENLKSVGEAHIAAIQTQIASGLRSDARDPEFVKITDARERRLDRELEQKREMYRRKGHPEWEVTEKVFIIAGDDGGVWDGFRHGHPD